MKTVALWTLIGINAVLVAAFVSKMSRPNTAQAQVARAGDYIMIPGAIIGGVNDVVYVLDQNIHQLGAMSYDDASKKLMPLGPARDLDRDFDSGKRR
jgi:hypothetical protein